MTVSSTITVFRTAGNGVTASFPYPSRFNSPSDLIVTLYNPTTGVTTPRILNTHYDITGTVTNGKYLSGGEVVFKPGFIPPTGETVVRDRILPLIQDSDYGIADPFEPDTLESDLDRDIMIAQQQQSQIDRSLKFPVEIPNTASMAAPVNRGVVYYDSATTSFKTDSSTIDSFATSTTAAAASAAAALASQNAAAASASAADASADDAADSAAAALVSENNAAASAAAAAGSFAGTSTTSLAIGTGTKVFTTQAGLNIYVGQYVIASSAANTANHMIGQVTAYTGTSLTLNVTKVGGSGTFADWGLALTGAPATGDVVGPASAGSNSLPLYDGTTGKLLKAGVALGSSGQVLTSNGAGVAPSFQTVSAGALVLISSTTVGSPVASVDFTGFTSTYSKYIVEISNLTFAANQVLSARLYQGSLISSGNYTWSKGYVPSSGTPTGNYNDGQTRLDLSFDSILTTNPASATIEIHNPALTVRPHISGKTMMRDTALESGDFYGWLDIAAATTGISFFGQSGSNIAAGSIFKLYGVVA